MKVSQDFSGALSTFADAHSLRNQDNINSK